MAKSYTFSLGYVFLGKSKTTMFTIVCNSDKPIDKNTVMAVATARYEEGVRNFQYLKPSLDHIMDGIEELGINAVIVPTDVVAVIREK